MNQIFFVDFGENKRIKDFTLEIIYNRPTFTFSLLIIVQIIFFIYSAFTDNGFIFSNDSFRVSEYGQYYRLVTAPFSTHGALIDMFWLITSFWWMLSIFPLHEHKYSSVHLLFELLIQNLLVQTIYCITSLAVAKFEGITQEDLEQGYGRYINMGWDSLVIIWVFMLTGINKKGKSYLFYLPIQINNEYLAWTISITTLSMARQRLPILIGTMLGSLQFHVLNRSLIRLPFKFYLLAEKPLKAISKYFPTFVSLNQINQDLSLVFSQYEPVPKPYDIKTYEEEEIGDLLSFEGPEISKGVNQQIVIQEIDKWVQKQDINEAKKKPVFNFDQ